MPPHPGKYRTKVVDGETFYLCMDVDHNAWLPESAFYKIKRRFPIHHYCKACCSERKKREYAQKATPEYLAAQRERQQARRDRLAREARNADKKYAAAMKNGDGLDRGFVRTAEVTPYYNRLMELYPIQRIAAEVSGVQDRVLRRIKKADSEWTEFEQAEKIAIAVGKGDQFVDAHVPVIGRPGWSRAGHIHCVDCGTCWHPHYGHGRCVACYAIYRGRTKGALPRDQQGWTKMYACCRRCGTTEKRHQGRGLCYTCRDWAKRTGNLDLYPPKTDRRPTPQSWRASADARKARRSSGSLPSACIVAQSDAITAS